MVNAWVKILLWELAGGNSGLWNSPCPVRVGVQPVGGLAGDISPTLTQGSTMLRAHSILMLAGILWIGPSLASADGPYMQYGPDYMNYGPDYMNYGPDYMNYGPDYMNYGPNFSNTNLNRGLKRCVNNNCYCRPLPYK